MLYIERNDSINVELLPLEIVERKGLGHPDTIADTLAESISREYSRYCLKEFGVILHHDIDKLTIVGGKTRVEFGGGEIVEPIKVYVNGRFSTRFGSHIVPYKDIINVTIIRHLEGILRNIEPEKHIKIEFSYSNIPSPGYVEGSEESNGSRKYWFAPRDKRDLPELFFLHANDTSMGVGFAPLTTLERFVLHVEQLFNSVKSKHTMPYIGTDIKVMGIRYYKAIEITIAIPIISQYVHSVSDYREYLEQIRAIVKSIAPSGYQVKIHINTRDNFEKPELYLSLTGSSLENGDIGVVGRGNRLNGLISPMRPMSIEAPCGKNPVYHVGKIYNVLASEISNELSMNTGECVNVFLVSQTGQYLLSPWSIGIYHTGQVDVSIVKDTLSRALGRLNELRARILSGDYSLCY